MSHSSLQAETERSRRSFTALGILLGACIAASPAAATFHLMRIAEVYGGNESHPDGQYVVLQMCNSGQNQVGDHQVFFYDAAGTDIGHFAFADDVGNSATQAKILIATSSAETAFGVAADLLVPAKLLVAGGKFCFDTDPIDCFAWGSYAGSATGVGTPFDAANGLSPGSAAIRDKSIAGGPTTMDCFTSFDDTDDSAADFDAGPPAPKNNANVVGALVADLIFVHGFESGSPDGWIAEPPES